LGEPPDRVLRGPRRHLAAGHPLAGVEAAPGGADHLSRRRRPVPRLERVQQLRLAASTAAARAPELLRPPESSRPASPPRGPRPAGPLLVAVAGGTGVGPRPLCDPD